MNEVTFVAKLGAFTFSRFSAAREAGRPVLIAHGDVEEKQIDAQGACRRCDMRLSTAGNRKLVSGEMKRPEVPEGRDPRNEKLVADARGKAVARGLPIYFTCNMASVVLWEVSLHSGVPDKEIGEYNLAPLKSSAEAPSFLEEIQSNWNHFLDEVERHLTALEEARPAPTAVDVIRLQQAIIRIAEEGAGRAERFLRGNPHELEAARAESSNTFGYPFDLNPTQKAAFRQETEQVLRLAAFVVAQKLILHRVLAETGRRLPIPFKLDLIELPRGCTDPGVVKDRFHRAVSQATHRSQDFETAFLPTPNESLLFLEPGTREEIDECHVGEAWVGLLDAINAASWSAISHNLVGFLYEAIVDPNYRHALGQHYTQKNVVDFLTTFVVDRHTDLILDPAAGGGSFLASAYALKRMKGATHSDALAEVWGCELSSFAAELSTVTLATSDPSAPSAYPRVILMDFFDMRPGMKTTLVIPGKGPAKVPKQFDGIVGNPPYISYRHQTNQAKVLEALNDLPAEIVLPKLSGKSDEYIWFLLQATRFLKNSGRLGFVVSSALLFSDYGIPLIRFLAQHYRIRAVIDSMVERWFTDADVNTVLLLLEREADPVKRSSNQIRFARFRRPLAQLLPPPLTANRRDALEDLSALILCAPAGDTDPRFTCILIEQGQDAGVVFAEKNDESDEELAFGEEEE
jgi:hypothetical protein